MTGGPLAAGSRAWLDELPPDLEAQTDVGRPSLRGPAPDGSRLVARPVLVASEEDAERVRQDVQAFAQRAGPHLVWIRGAAFDRGAVWVLFEEPDGITLHELMARTDLAVPHSVSLALDVLAGLAALQSAGLGHGALNQGTVYVSRRGHALLDDYLLRGQVWPQDDLIAAGRVACALLGVPTEPEPGELREAERVVPAFVAIARALAGGRLGGDANAALAAATKGAAHLGEPASRSRSSAELAALVRGEPPPSFPPPEASVTVAEPPSAPAKPTPPTPTEAAEPDPAPRRNRGRRRLLVGAAAFLVALVGLLAFALEHGTSTARPAALVPPPPTDLTANGSPAPAATPTPSASLPPSAAPTPALLLAATPNGAVDRFYQLVVQHDFAGAVQLWSPSMRAAYPPDENIDQRFAQTSSIQVVRSDVVSSGGGRATVAVDLIEVRAGRTYRWTGSWLLVQSSSGWLLDQPQLRQA